MIDIATFNHGEANNINNNNHYYYYHVILSIIVFIPCRKL